MTTIRVAGSVEDLLAGATMRRPMKNGDSLSGSTFERAVIGGEPYVVKYFNLDDDWLMRATGDLGRQGVLWRSALVDSIPAEIDHTVVGIAEYRAAAGRTATALLMRDAGPLFVPEGGTPLPDERHLRFLDHMAALHAGLWGWHDEIGLMPFASTYTILTPLMSSLEAARGGGAGVPSAVAAGWARFRNVAPRAAGVVLSLLDDPGPLIDALAATPATFLQGDWKLGNLGSHPDGRTILVDWDRSGEGPACSELAWYLAVNCDRMRVSKEDAAGAYRRSLEARGVDTGPWWEAQLGLCLLGAFLMLGWAKAGGDPAELGWWEERTLEAVRHLR